MKIAILGSAHPLRGGLAAFNERLALQLQQQGHTVDIWSFSLQYPGFLFPGKTQYTDEPAPSGLSIKTKVNSVNPLNWLRVGAAMNRERYDLIIVKFWLPFMGPCFGTILRRAKKNGHTRVVCVVDNMIPHEKRPGDLPFTRYFIPPIDAFVTMSRDVLKDVKTFTAKPSFFTPHPVYDSYLEAVSKDEACRKLGLDPAKKYILFFGFIREYKGLDWLLEAMNDPRIREAGIELIAAGEYYSKDVEAHNNQIVEAHQLQPVVHLHTDFIPNSEVRYYFSAADLVVQPYKHATQSGITQIAYHFGKPMVVTNVGGLAEVVPDGQVGFVAEPNPTAIATAILRFYQPGSLPHLPENLLREKKKYTWETFVEVMMGAVFGEGNLKQPDEKFNPPITFTSTPSNPFFAEKPKDENGQQLQTVTQSNIEPTTLNVVQINPPKVQPVDPKAPLSQSIPVRTTEIEPASQQTEEERSTEKYIGYYPINIFAQSEPVYFPYVIMPKPNCIIKFPKKGRTGRKGYKEESFKEFITKYFKNQFQIFDDRYITVKNSLSPFEPDFTLIDEKDGRNIFLDIEIDEPYEGSNNIFTRKATHFQNSDTNRNNAFKNRGWIIIRFAEIQIHQNPDSSCRFIADVVKSINSNYLIPQALQNVATLIPVKQWTKNEAEVWSQQKYREKYLNIDNFGVVFNTDSEIEIETALDKKVEEKVQDDEPILISKEPKGNILSSTAEIITNALNSDQFLSFTYGGNKTIVKPNSIYPNAFTGFCYVKNKDVTYDISSIVGIIPKNSYFTLRLVGPSIGLDKVMNVVNTAIAYHKHLRMKYTRSSWTNIIVDHVTGELLTNSIEAEESIRTISNIKYSVDVLTENEINHYRLDENYITAYCNRRDEQRTFRFDRISEIEILDI